MRDLRLYILMRTDMPSMSAGRACAQASHVTNVFMRDIGDKLDVAEWQSQTRFGFGTAIVLGVTIKQLDQVLDGIPEKFQAGTCTDPDYRIKIPKEAVELLVSGVIENQKHIKVNDVTGEAVVTGEVVTCAYIFGDAVELAPYLGQLPLY